VTFPLASLFHRTPPSASAEALADAARTADLRAQVDSRWPDLLVRSGLAQERLARNHIGEALDDTIEIIRERRA
jgi:hypothetical protein